MQRSVCELKLVAGGMTMAWYRMRPTRHKGREPARRSSIAPVSFDDDVVAEVVTPAVGRKGFQQVMERDRQLVGSFSPAYERRAGFCVGGVHSVQRLAMGWSQEARLETSLEKGRS